MTSADAQLGIADATESGTILQGFGGGLMQLGSPYYGNVAYAPSASFGYYGRR